MKNPPLGLLKAVMGKAKRLVLGAFLVGFSAAALAQISVGGVSGSGQSVTTAFGEVQIGQTKVMTVVLGNSNAAGGADVVFTNEDILVSVPFSISAADNGCKGKTLTPLSTCIIAIRFSPTAAAIYSSFIRIPVNGIPGVFVNLSGTGTSAGGGSVGTLTITPASSEASRIPISTKAGVAGTQILTLTATGGSVTISGVATPDAWGINNLCGATITTGLSCVIMVYTAIYNETGSYPEEYVLQTNSGPYIVYVSADVTDVATGASGTLTATPSSLNFGTLRPGASVSKALTLSASAQNVSLTSIDVPTGYTVSHSCGALIPAGGSCSVTVKFNPTAKIGYNGSIVINSNATGSPHFVTLTGAGGDSTNNVALLALDSAILSYGEVSVGQSSQLVAGLANRGGAALSATFSTTGTGFTVVGGDCVSGSSITLAGGATCSMTVKFTPTIIGAHSGKIAFSGTGAENLQISLKGNGVGGSGSTGSAAGLQVTPSSLAFGNVSVGSSAVQVLSFTTNSGSQPAITSAQVPAGYVLDRTCAASSTTSCNLTLAFTPTEASSYDGMIIATATDGSTVFLTVTGQGTLGTQMRSVTNGSLSALDLAGIFSFAAANAQGAGNLYVAAWYANNLYFMSGGQWTPFVSGVEPPAYTTANAGSIELTIMNGLDVRGLAGAVIFLGYGRNLDEMVRNKQFTPIYVIN